MIKRACVFAKRIHACLSVSAYAPYVCLKVVFFPFPHTKMLLLCVWSNNTFLKQEQEGNCGSFLR